MRPHSTQISHSVVFSYYLRGESRGSHIIPKYHNQSADKFCQVTHVFYITLTRFIMLSVVAVACVGAAAFSLYLVALVLYRLFWHPLAAFPGPRLAAITVLYEFYHDGIKGGKFIFKIKDMHDKYGPIVRISPDELHCNDPTFIDTLYAGGSVRRDKYVYYTGQFGVSESVFGTVHHDHHRLRRSAINRFFSKASVAKLEPMIHEKLDKLYRQLYTHMGDDKPLRLDMAFSCFVTDVITVYAFSKCSDFLSDASFERNLHESIVAGTDLGHYTKHLPSTILPLMKSLPDSWVKAMSPQIGIYLQFQRDLEAQILEIRAQREAGSGMGKQYNLHPTIFHELLESDLPDIEKSNTRLWQESQAIIGAGTETTAWTLSVLFFHVLNNRDIYETLMMELQGAIPDATSRPVYNDLEKLPYLGACILEGLRLSYGVSARLQRISPDGTMLYRSSDAANDSKPAYIIPRGTPVGMTSVTIHHNPDIFPNSTEFDPRRWLDTEGKRDRTLEKYLLSFSRGSRQCIGINLAHAELYMATALIFRRLGPHLKLYKTDISDVEMLYDYFIPKPKLDSKGVRVLLV
ncbi:putative cytochrome P450 [Hypomontagnella submonticulosa]|nr:putative cytochrome P450 [Hypomontagnella submonticulosa]